MADKRGKATVRLPNLCEGWPEIRTNLQKLADKTARGLDELEQIYKEMDRWESVSIPLTLLRRILADANHVTEEFFCETLLPWVAQKAVQVEELFKNVDHTLPRMNIGYSGSVELTRLQACCLLALAFFNVLPPVSSVSRQQSPSGTYQQLTLAMILMVDFLPSQRAKMLCILQYFRRVMQAEVADDQQFLSMKITVERKGLTGNLRSVWRECDKPLSPFEQPSEGLIEDAEGCLQVDFANEFIGGGVLGMGNVQEEIRFVINPECLVSLLFCERMESHEAILITGAEQFSSYSGYGNRFKFTGPLADSSPIDVNNQRCVSIVAIDAIPFQFSGEGNQFNREAITRELNKAFCGFSFVTPMDDETHSKRVPVATGNWGCGAFGGDKELKTLIQWMAASRAGRTIRYYSFSGDGDLKARQEEVTKCLLECGVTVGKLFDILTSTRLRHGAVFNDVMSKAREH